MERPAGEPEPERLGGRLPLSFQYAHVQLAGGAPWGFTLKGGLEHGEPLIVSKVEDGGKAAQSQKMRPGDELVNINGTPLYGSRQEALILIKGSYRTLKMIIRRRNVPVLRPHSWHLAKLSEVRTEAAATMHFPADAFSLSWHSGCDGSDLPLPWDPLSRHCSTDRSSSLGSMESLEPPGQTYLEGSLSPVDQAMDPDKRDSAYSSFSASSNASDSALRPEEGSAGDGPQPGQPPDPRYLQTGGGGEPVHPHASPCSSSHSPRAPGPPQPPLRQDSLQACPPPPQRASPQADPLQSRGRWTSDTSLCVRSRDPKGQAAEAPPADQYYLLSSHMEKGAQAAEPPSREEGGGPVPEEPAQRVAGGEAEAPPGSPDSCPSPPWRGECWPGLLAHRHSAPEHLLAAQLQALDVAPGQEGAPCWTVSPLHPEPRGARASEQAQEPDPRPAPGGGGAGGLGRPRSASTELAPARLPQPPADAAPGPAAVPGGGRDAGEGQVACRRGGSAPQRPAQARRRSDRFATNLRNEIQWRKAQLQRGKGAPLLLGGEEPVREAGEAPLAPARPPPTPARAPVESRPRTPAAPPRTAPPKRWGSELSVLQADRAGQSSGRGSPAPGPQRQSPLAEAQRPPKTLPLLPLPGGGGSGGRWRWSPEHKLQPQGRGLPAARPGSPAEEEEEGGLLPFSERRRFFEETSRPPPPAHLSPLPGRPAASRAPRGAEQGPCQAVGCGCRDQRRHSMDQAYAPPSPPPLRPQDFLRAEAPPCHQPLARRGDWECWRPLPCSCAAARDPPCACCGADRCPALLQRNLSMPAGRPGHHCPPRCWARCHRDCCCPARHAHLEDGAPWHARRTFQAEFPVAEWEPPAINRKSSQSMSELAQLQAGFARAGPFWPSREGIGEPEWAPIGRAVSTHSLAWDCERPEQAAFEEGPGGEPRKHPLRERAYSESHLPAEPAGAAARERRDTPLARLEEAELEPPPAGRKKGPPPPRPPPPNWEKYCPRRASHHQLLSSRGGLVPTPEDARAPAPAPTAVEVARQRSQSLPLEQLWHGAPWQPGPRPQEGPPPAEHGHPHYCHRGSARGTTEWPTPDPRDRGSSSRPGGSPEEDRRPEPRWDQGPKRPASRTSEQLPSSASGRAPPGQEALQEAAPPLRPDSEELMRDVAGRDRSLAGVLSPTRGLVTAAEVMGGLFSPGECPAWQGQDWQPQAGGTAFPGRQPTSPTPVGAVSPTSCSAYYNLSAGKAELLNKMKALPEPAGASSEEEGEEDRDLARKKVQLIESISRKLAVLQEAQRGLQEDVGANLALGREVEGHVQRVCRPQECEKFRLFLGDLDKVVNLLLSLSGRLARVENALGGLDADTPEEEKLALLEKKRQLTAQLEDAQELQEHVARRERLVFACVSRCLPSEPLQDYQHFVRMKSALAVQQRQLDDKIKLGEEQLRCLRESLRRAHREY